MVTVIIVFSLIAVYGLFSRAPDAKAASFWVIIAMACLLLASSAHAFGPIPKKDQCISVNALLNRNCAPVYMCNGTAETNADWCCSTTQRWFSEEQKLKRWYKRNCKG